MPITVLVPERKSFLQNGSVRTLIALVGGTLVEQATAYLAGVQAPWAPYVLAVVTALWNVWKNPSAVMPNVVVRDGPDGTKVATLLTMADSQADLAGCPRALRDRTGV